MPVPSPQYLIDILLPMRTGEGAVVSRDWFDDLLRELTEEFGGATSFIRSPGEGLWDSGERVEADEIVIVEVMTQTLDSEYWGALRQRLESELHQREIVIRAQTITQL